MTRENGLKVGSNKQKANIMNIFFLHIDPKLAAQYQCDKHVVKMIIETAQLLYCAHWMLCPEEVPTTAYKKSHPKHPSAIWARESIENYTWLCQLGIELCYEYTHRYGKTHKTQYHIEWLIANIPKNIPLIKMTPLRLAMPDEYKREDPVESYRLYYIGAKTKLMQYTKRDKPPFLPVRKRGYYISTSDDDLQEQT